jgi:serine/threonine protein kinase
MIILAFSQFRAHLAKNGLVPSKVKGDVQKLNMIAINKDYWEKEVEKRHIGGTAGYIAPELITPGEAGKKLYDEYFSKPSCDVFVAGLIFYALLSKVPKIVKYRDKKNNEANQKLYQSKREQHKLTIDECTPDKIKATIKRAWGDHMYPVIESRNFLHICLGCLAIDPAKRLTAEEALVLLGRRI